MKLIELEIANIRGIRSLVLRPEGNNMVIWGPNGSGKSAVVDSIDFLLTGRISRLTGPTTGGISLARHGPHIEASQEEAIVRAVVDVPGADGPVELRRCIASPDTLECDERFRPQLAPILALAERGQHVLTRREILKYIATQAGARAEEIQQLLNLSEVERVRRALVTTERGARTAVQQARDAVTRSESRVATVLGLPTFSEEQVLIRVNQLRATLRASGLDAPRSGSLLGGLQRPVEALGRNTSAIQGAASALSTLRGLLTTPQRETRLAALQSAQEQVARLHADPTLERAMRHRQLLHTGVGLLDDTGICPLCEAQWDATELRGRIQARLESAATASAATDELMTATSTLRSVISTSVTALSRLIDSPELASELEVLTPWGERLSHLHELVSTGPSGALGGELPGAEEFAFLAGPADVDAVVERLDRMLSASSPAASPEQDAWDLLTRLDEALNPLESSSLHLERTSLVSRRAAALSAAYETARNHVLQSLYDSVRDRFVALYRQLHGADEEDFDAELQPEGPGLELRVGFHGRGVYPPQALHSEGHQDTMGICLYLALAERLTTGVIQMTILDDVMMSVDTDHRRGLSRLLAGAFSDRQLIITTHDRTWASQLRTEGVVTTRHSLHLYDWDLTTGPRTVQGDDLWSRIQTDLAGDDVPTAAHRLRRGAEEYFADVCENLWAPVRFKQGGRFDLGDLVPAAIGRYRELLKRAKKAANSWDRREVMERVGEIESTTGQMFSRSQAEQWSVNENVHFNTWANFTRADFEPVVAAFADLFDVYRCSSCRTALRIVADGMVESSLQCACGETTFQLLERPDTS